MYQGDSANIEHIPAVKLKPYRMTRREFMALAWWFRRKRNLLLIGLSGLVCWLYFNITFVQEEIWNWTIPASIFIAVFTVMLVQIAMLIRAAYARENRSAFAERHVEFDDQELRAAHAMGAKASIPFNMVVKVREPGPFYLLYISRVEAALVPKNAFESREDEKKFRQILVQHDLLRAA